MPLKHSINYDIAVQKISKGQAGRTLCNLSKIPSSSSIGSIKKAIQNKSGMSTARISIRLGLGKEFKNIKDEALLEELHDFKQNAQGPKAEIYVKDLGPQIAWKTVFLTEYGGPLALYLIFYFRLIPQIYGLGTEAFGIPAGASNPTVKLAMICHTLHYAKRELETLFIHRFSNGTMPLRNIFKNSAYYWGFGAALGYYVNHPLYTAPPDSQVTFWMYCWAIMELGNLSIHIALRNLRPPGTKIRRIPMPNSNPFTWLFNFTSCPNYTYEIAGWICFTFMTNCFMSGVFTFVGFMQMMVWAQGKRRNYIKEFGDKYPKKRTALVPFLI